MRTQRLGVRISPRTLIFIYFCFWLNQYAEEHSISASTKKSMNISPVAVLFSEVYELKQTNDGTKIKLNWRVRIVDNCTSFENSREQSLHRFESCTLRSLRTFSLKRITFNAAETLIFEENFTFRHFCPCSSTG